MSALSALSVLSSFDFEIMNTTQQILPGIKAIYWLDSRHLPRRVDLHAIAGDAVAVLTDLYPIRFTDTPECSCVSERDNGGYVETASLTFACLDLLPIHRPLAFVVTDIAGCHWLIGAKEHPQPLLKVEALCGTPDGDHAGFRYEIKHVAVKSMTPCLI